MSEIDQRHDPMVLLGVIAEQNQALEGVIAERDELRAHLESLGERLEPLLAYSVSITIPKPTRPTGSRPQRPHSDLSAPSCR